MAGYKFEDRKAVDNLLISLPASDELIRFLRLMVDELFSLKQKVGELERRIEKLEQAASKRESREIKEAVDWMHKSMMNELGEVTPRGPSEKLF